jgi:fluoroacetyl-CoA thioesterase
MGAPLSERQMGSPGASFGDDACYCGKTPSGKTAGFFLPVEELGPLLLRMALKRMPLVLNLPTGLSGTAELVVGEQHTAPRIGSGRIRVLATPVMINLIEAAALAAVEQSLPEEHQSLGTRLNVSHIAATPVGMRVRATAEVVKVEGRTIHFHVRA